MRENLRRAVAIATAAWTNDRAAWQESASVLIRQFIEEDPSFEANILFGFTNLVTMLLVELESATGQPGGSFLEGIARRCAG